MHFGGKYERIIGQIINLEAIQNEWSVTFFS